MSTVPGRFPTYPSFEQLRNQARTCSAPCAGASDALALVAEHHPRWRSRTMWHARSTR